MEVVLDDNEVLENTKIDIPKLAVENAQHLSQWKKDTAKFRRIILEGVRDHIVLNLHGKENPFDMCETLTKLFKNGSDATKFPLRDKLRNICMQKNETNHINSLDSLNVKMRLDKLDKLYYPRR